MKSLNFPVERALVLVCEKCGRRVDDADVGRSFYKRLRKALKANFGKGQFRVLETSCMDICPKNAIAVSVCPRSGPSAIFQVQSSDDVERVARELGAKTANVPGNP